MSVCLLIIMIIKDQLSFDQFHENKDNIYRINTRIYRPNGSTEPYASTSLPIHGVIKNEYALAESVIRIRRGFSGDVTANGATIPVKGLFADKEFFEVFSFDLLEGDPSTALEKPFSVIIKEETSKKFFGDESPVGQTYKLKDRDYTITGVLKKPESKTHFEFESLASMSSVTVLENEEKLSPSLERWENTCCQTY